MTDFLCGLVCTETIPTRVLSGVEHCGFSEMTLGPGRNVFQGIIPVLTPKAALSPGFAED